MRKILTSGSFWIIASICAAGCCLLLAPNSVLRPSAENPAAGKWVVTDPEYKAALTVGGKVRYKGVLGESGSAGYTAGPADQYGGIKLELLGNAPYDSLVWHRDVLPEGTEIEVLSALTFEYDGRGPAVIDEYVRPKDLEKLPEGYRSSFADPVSSTPLLPMYNIRPESLRVEDLTETIGWLDVPYGESGAEIPESFFEKDSSIRSLKVEGRLQGFECEGFVIFGRDYETEDMKAEKIELTSDSSWDEMKLAFTESFGEPLDGGQIPYAQSQGGAIDWCLFKTEEGYVKLMQASEYDYVRIELYKTYYDR